METFFESKIHLVSFFLICTAGLLWLSGRASRSNQPLDYKNAFIIGVAQAVAILQELRPLTGRDAPVITFLEAEAEVRRMRDDIARFVDTWLPCYIRDNRNYLTVGIGCTGGQHRSVYLAERLGQRFADRWITLVRHREVHPGLN